MEASTIGYNDNNLGSFIFLYAWAMFIFKSFREVKFYHTSVQSPHTGSGKHVSGWQNDARAWGWEAVSRRACRETARGVCGRSWDHASKGQGDRCLMRFLGGRCLRAEMCIWVRGAEVRLNKSASWRPKDRKRETGSFAELPEAAWCAPCSDGMLLALFSGQCPSVPCLSRQQGTHWGLLCSKNWLGIWETLWV